MNELTAPGIYELGEAEYHADPCPAPSLSHSILRTLLQRSPLHAHAEHPRLGANTEETDEDDGDDETAKMDAGSIIHKLMLGKGADIVEITATYDAKHKHAGKPVRDFRTQAAKAERAMIRKAGKLPVLKSAFPALRKCAETALAQMRDHQDLKDFFAPGRSEAVVAWQENGLWFRAMVDRLPDAPTSPILDIKTTGMSAAVETWERRMVHEYATQAVFYPRGVQAVRKIKPGPFLFIVIEQDPPFAMSVMSPAPSLAFYAEKEVERAISIWRQCLTTGVWPGYPALTAHIELPTYMETKKAERIFRESLLRTGKQPADWDNEFYHEFGDPRNVV